MMVVETRMLMVFVVIEDSKTGCMLSAGCVLLSVSGCFQGGGGMFICKELRGHSPDRARIRLESY